MKKWLAFLIIIIYLAFCSTARAADELSLQCKSALLLDGDSGQVLYEQNADEKCYPASVTKIMTMVLIMEAVNAGTISLDDVVTVSQEAADMGGSQVYLYPGEQRSVDEMMIAIAVGSGNDAAYAMAEFVGGTYGNFIQMMNDKAAELGMSGTHFVNPHGLHDDDHYTTASDLGKLAFYAAGLPGLLDYTSIYEYEFRPEPNLLTLWNTNRLLKWYDGAIGMKTGYTEEAGRNLVAVAERDGLRLISVVLGCGERQGHFRESMDLLNYGFNTFTRQVIYEKGTKVAQIPVSKGESDSVDLVAAVDAGYTCRKAETAEITQSTALQESLSAPVARGDVGGVLTLYKDGRELQTVDLVAAADVPKGGLFRTWKKLLHMAL
ncbi:MAG: D-alanyl-D-alanine carboxypeptidase [Firmicutes bacterium]|nr:D-alanyl-D-alanine carboxypeptidase [Bacillota bacterium]